MTSELTIEYLVHNNELSTKNLTDHMYTVYTIYKFHCSVNVYNYDIINVGVSISKISVTHINKKEL